jgi:hypothetical protein
MTFVFYENLNEMNNFDIILLAFEEFVCHGPKYRIMRAYKLRIASH